MNEFLRLLSTGATLSEEQAEQAMHHLMKGDADPIEIAGFLMALRSRGETLDELVGFTRVMREYAVPVSCPDPHAIDLCGTGGDQSGTFNISTTAAIVCAGAGVTVAKHGNRSISSKSGSADVLKALGVQIELGKEGVEYCLEHAGIAFIFAPFFHPALKYVMPVRRTLRARTFFNILGPLCNPAGVKRQIVGAFSLDVAKTMAQILAALNAEHVVAVHSRDGLDECSLSAPTDAFMYSPKMPNVATDTISPEQFGLQPAPLNALKGDTADENAVILNRILDGEPGPPRDIVLLNATYALLTSGRFESLDACFKAASDSIDSGNARESLKTLIAVSQKAPAHTA